MDFITNLEKKLRVYEKHKLTLFFITCQYWLVACFAYKMNVSSVTKEGKIRYEIKRVTKDLVFHNLN